MFSEIMCIASRTAYFAPKIWNYSISVLIHIEMMVLPFKSLAPNNEVKEVLKYIRFNIVHRNMAKSIDPDETSHATSHLGLRYL